MTKISATPRLSPGDMVTERVRLVEPLGRGGMGSVWVAEHLTLRTDVAVKFVSVDRMVTDPSSVSRFMGEASAAAQIQSPHVVRMFDHGITDDGLPFIVMERLQGETLRERLRRAGAMAPLEVAVMLRQLCRALTAAHKKGIVHRDIKPDNIFLLEVEVDPDDSGAFADSLFVKVVDFGLAKRMDLSVGLDTSTGTMVGTPSYMSPEQALSKKEPDPRADLWAASVVAFHALTGEVPFRGETLGSLCVSIAHGEFVSPSALRRGLPPTVDRFFERGFASDIDDRFQTPGELARAFLEAVKMEDPVATLSVGIAEDRAAEPDDLRPVPTLGGSSLVATPSRAETSVWRRGLLAIAVVAVVAAVAALVAFPTDETPSEPASAAPLETEAPAEPSDPADVGPDESSSEPTEREEPVDDELPEADSKPPADEPNGVVVPRVHPEPKVVEPEAVEPDPPTTPAPVRDWAF